MILKTCGNMHDYMYLIPFCDPIMSIE